MPVDPTGHDLKRMLAEGDQDAPVVMLNLLRFAPDGRASYDEYVRRFPAFAERYGAEVVFVGDCSTALVAPDAHDWDALLLVRYPTRRAFSRMVADEEYQQITHLRTAALEEAVLQVVEPWT